MDSYRIPSESTGCGSDSVTVYWQIADRTLYLKGSGCVSDFSDVGYHGGIDTIVIEDGIYKDIKSIIFDKGTKKFFMSRIYRQD